MTSLRIVMLLVTVLVCYLLVLQAQPTGGTDQEKLAAVSTASALPNAPSARSEYKQAMDKAHAAAGQMQAARQEADSF